MKITHPNRLNKRRGSKLNEWVHNSYPATEKEKVEIESKLNDTTKFHKKSNSKKKEYEVWTLWKGFSFNNNQVIEWNRHSKYMKLDDAIFKFEKIKKEKKYYIGIRIIYKKEILKEFIIDSELCKTE